MIENFNGTTNFIGTPAITVLGEDSVTWGVQVVADDAADTLRIQVWESNELVR